MLIGSHALFIISGETWYALKSGFGVYNWISPNHSWLEKRNMPSKILENKRFAKKKTSFLFFYPFYISSTNASTKYQDL